MKHLPNGMTKKACLVLPETIIHDMKAQAKQEDKTLSCLAYEIFVDYLNIKKGGYAIKT